MANNQITERIEQTLASQHKSMNQMIKELDLTVNPFMWKTRGTVPRADVAVKIARYLNVSSEWLITGEESKQNDIHLIYDLLNSLPEAKRKQAIEFILFLKN